MPCTHTLAFTYTYLPGLEIRLAFLGKGLGPFNCVFGSQKVGLKDRFHAESLFQGQREPPDDGFLTFSNVLKLKLDAQLVSLAACMTGVGQVMQGEGVLNFARAFEQAGARSVMVTLWNIPVQESLRFYSLFFRDLKEGKTKIQALQDARKSIRKKEPHPYFWSGIILHGEG